jgi:hypothetical protein
LIVGNEEKTLLCSLTIKLFQAIARHLFVLTYRWVIECLKQNQITDEVLFEIRGDIPFGGYHDGMRNSRLSKQRNLFGNCQFFILCNGCQDKMVRVKKLERSYLLVIGYPFSRVICSKQVAIEDIF